jgi:predicted transcriptional regulator
MASERRSMRRRIGISKARTARLAGVSVPLVRLYEIDPEEVKDSQKRAALDRTYDGFAELAAVVCVEVCRP